MSHCCQPSNGNKWLLHLLLSGVFAVQHTNPSSDISVNAIKHFTQCALYQRHTIRKPATSLILHGVRTADDSAWNGNLISTWKAVLYKSTCLLCSRKSENKNTLFKNNLVLREINHLLHSENAMHMDCTQEWTLWHRWTFHGLFSQKHRRELKNPEYLNHII